MSNEKLNLTQKCFSVKYILLTCDYLKLGNSQTGIVRTSDDIFLHLCQHKENLLALKYTALFSFMYFSNLLSTLPSFSF